MTTPARQHGRVFGARLPATPVRLRSGLRVLKLARRSLVFRAHPVSTVAVAAPETVEHGGDGQHAANPVTVGVRTFVAAQQSDEEFLWVGHSNLVVPAAS